MKRIALLLLTLAALALVPAALADPPGAPSDGGQPATVPADPAAPQARPADTAPATPTPPVTPVPPPTKVIPKAKPKPLPLPKPKPVVVPKIVVRPKPKPVVVPKIVVPPKPKTLPPGLRIAGVPVGGLTPAAAEAALRAAFARPLVLHLGTSTRRVAPGTFGAVAYVEPAIRRFQSANGLAHAEVFVRVEGSKVRSYVRDLASRFDAKPVSAVFSGLRNGAPTATKSIPGRKLDTLQSTALIVRSLVTGSRAPITLPVVRTQPAVTEASFTDPLIVIKRGANVLNLYFGVKLERSFRVATGQPAYPTPVGKFAIQVMWRNPWWYPPNSPWAAGEKPTPPGPGNPLGTRWMGLTAPGVGIHGTPHDDSIGYSLSHGCIRMHIPEAEWLFDHVRIGTAVYILA